MSYAKPIWNDVTSCRYKKSPSWGAFDDCKTETYTGSSSSNSELLAEVEVSRKFYDRIVVFNFYIDSKLLKQNINLRNGDKAGKFLEQRKRAFVNSDNQHTHPINKKVNKLTNSKII
jgi:hypothetical protein